MHNVRAQFYQVQRLMSYRGSKDTAKQNAENDTVVRGTVVANADSSLIASNTSRHFNRITVLTLTYVA